MSRKLVYWFQENWKRIWVLVLWILLISGLFLWKFYQYIQKSVFQVMGYCRLTAAGAAETLKFNMALILLPVCRNTITCLRSAKLSSFVPFDDNINFYKTVAAALVTGIILHAGNYLVCDFPKLIRVNSTDYQKYLVNDFGPTEPRYIDLVKGVESVTGLITEIKKLERLCWWRLQST